MRQDGGEKELVVLGGVTRLASGLSREAKTEAPL